MDSGFNRQSIGLFDHLIDGRQSLSSTWRPNAFAVLRLMTSSNFVGCTSGRSARFKILEGATSRKALDYRMGRVPLRGRADAPDQAAASARARMARGRRAAPHRP